MGTLIGTKKIWTMPKRFVKALKDEAEKRIKLYKVGTQMGSVERDIVCLALQIAMKEVKNMEDMNYKRRCSVLY
jgi:hypothetical protein